VIRVERAIDVERSATEVFDRLTRIEDLPHWQPAILEAALESPPPIGTGSRIRLVADVAGQRTVAHGTVTRLERPGRLALDATAGPAEVQADVTITPTGDASCRVGLVSTVQLGGLLRFVEGVARARIEAEAPAVVASIKEWLESDEAERTADDGQTRSA
jgi:Polyketide cyclase / dehydrase and lipid transport